MAVLRAIQQWLLPHAAATMSANSASVSEWLVGGEGFAVGASLIRADANRQRCGAGRTACHPRRQAGRSTSISQCSTRLPRRGNGGRAKVRLAGRSAARWACAHGGQAHFTYYINYLIDPRPVAYGRSSRPPDAKVEMLFAHLKRILKLDRLRLRGPNGAKDEFHLAASVQNLRIMAKPIPMPIPTMAV